MTMKALKKGIQPAVQTIGLVLFILLLMVSKIQMWMGFILLGLALSLLFGRVYCGWICPINTAMKVVTWIKRKFKFKGFKVPAFLTAAYVRYGVLLLFAVTFALTLVTGKKLPVLPSLFLLGVLLTVCFPEEVWHRYLCPYGTLMKFPAFKAKHALKIDSDNCSGCGICERTCPAKAVVKVDHQFQIEKSECLVCFACQKKCRKGAICFK